MNEGAPHQNGRILRLSREEHGGQWYLNNSVIVNRACTKWLHERGISTDKYNLNFGSLYAKKTQPLQKNEG